MYEEKRKKINAPTSFNKSEIGSMWGVEALHCILSITAAQTSRDVVPALLQVQHDRGIKDRREQFVCARHHPSHNSTRTTIQSLKVAANYGVSTTVLQVSVISDRYIIVLSFSVHRS